MPLPINQNKNLSPERNPEYTQEPQSLTLKSVLSSSELTDNLWVRNCQYSQQRLEQVPQELDYFLDSVERAEELVEFTTEKIAVLRGLGETAYHNLSYDDIQDVLELLHDWPKNLLETSINFNCASKFFSCSNSQHTRDLHEVSLEATAKNEREQKRATMAFIALASREVADGVPRDQSYFVSLLGLAPSRRVY